MIIESESKLDYHEKIQEAIKTDSIINLEKLIYDRISLSLTEHIEILNDNIITYPNMRNFTPQEALDYQARLLKISKPTGENFHDEI